MLIKLPSTTPSNPLISLYFNIADPKLSCTKRLHLAGLLNPFGFQENTQIKEQEILFLPLRSQVLKLLQISTRKEERISQRSAIPATRGIPTWHRMPGIRYHQEAGTSRCTERQERTQRKHHACIMSMKHQVIREKDMLKG